MAAYDAEKEAQAIVNDMFFAAALQRAFDAGRREGVEAAAKVAEELDSRGYLSSADRTIGDEIRALLTGGSS